MAARKSPQSASHSQAEVRPQSREAPTWVNDPGRGLPGRSLMASEARTIINSSAELPVARIDGSSGQALIPSGPFSVTRGILAGHVLSSSLPVCFKWPCKCRAEHRPPAAPTGELCVHPHFGKHHGRPKFAQSSQPPASSFRATSRTFSSAVSVYDRDHSVENPPKTAQGLRTVRPA
jgi:hypothetical protein